MPDRAERAAEAVAGIGVRLDRALLAHIANGDRLPRLSELRRDVLGEVRPAVEVALSDIDPDVSAEAVDELTRAITAALLGQYQRAADDARRRRRSVVSAAPVSTDIDITPNATNLPRLARQIGFASAVAAVLRRSRRPIPRSILRVAAAQTGNPLPVSLAATLRATIRTDVAAGRNMHAADVVDRNGDGWALYIRDALAGSDEPCMRVDRKFATATWLRRHPVEHPNCTREGRPMRLPAGQRITLLR